MFLREVVTRRKASPPVRYAQIVEAYRNEEGKSRHRVLLSLGRVDRLDKDSLRRLVLGLSRYLDDGPPADAVVLEDVRDFGIAYAMHGIWRQVGLRVVIRRLLGRRPGSSRIERGIFVLAVHRMSTGGADPYAFPWFRDQAWVPGTRRVTAEHVEEAIAFVSARGEDLGRAVADALDLSAPEGWPGADWLGIVCAMLESWIEGRAGAPYVEVRSHLARIRAVERKVGASSSIWETSMPTRQGRELFAPLGLSAPPRNLPRPPKCRS